MGFASLDSLTQAAAAIAVFLSAIVSLLGTSARQRAVAEGRARASDLCELAGIFEPKTLQDVFGPPTMEGFWPHVTMQRVAQVRRPAGHLLSGDLVDYACMAVAALSFFVGHWMVDFLLFLAVGAQVSGWVLATRLPRMG